MRLSSQDCSGVRCSIVTLSETRVDCIEAGQQEQEPAPEDTERHEPERPELTKRLEEPEGQVIKGPDPERL